MKNPELYKAVKTISVPSFSFRDLKGEVAFLKEAPFQDEHAAFSLISVNGSLGQETSELNTKLIQISPYHGRSFELRMAGQTFIYFYDQFGNLFATQTLKGNNLEVLNIAKNANTPTGIIFWGLQDSFAMVRILRASQMMRADRIDTEVITRTVEPKMLPVDDELVSLEEFKKRLVKKVWDKNNSQDNEDEALTREDVLKVAKAVDDTTFLITTRGMQVPERFEDLKYVEEEEDFKEILKRVFQFVNFKEQGEIAFDYQNKDDIERYFGSHLPQKLATNYGKLHNLGLVHKYAHPGNVSLVGSIYDLDSVRGKPLGLKDKKITDEDIKRDLATLLYHYQDLTGIFPILSLIVKNNFISRDVMENFEYNFIKKYLEVRNIDTNSLSDILKAVFYFDSNGFLSVGAHKFANEFLSDRIERPVVEVGKAELFAEAIVGSPYQPFDYLDEFVQGVISDEMGTLIEPLEVAAFKFSGVYYLWEIMKHLIAESLVGSLSKDDEKKIVNALTDKSMSKRFIKNNWEKIYQLGLNFVCWDIEQQVDFEKFKERAQESIDKYLEVVDFKPYETEQSKKILDLATERGYDSRLNLVYEHKNTLAVNEVPMEDYLQILSDSTDSLNINAITSRKSIGEEFPFEGTNTEVLVGSSLSGPRVLFTDGVISKVWKHRLVIKNASYIAWIGEKQRADLEGTNFYIQTTLKAKELKKLFKKHQNLQLRTEYFAS